MFVFNNLSDVDDRGIQALLREVSSDVLVLALKGSDEGVKEKIFKNMSKRATELLRDDLEAKGPVRVSDVQTAQKEILTIDRRMRSAERRVGKECVSTCNTRENPCHEKKNRQQILKTIHANK